jgi:hypothetical protein
MSDVFERVVELLDSTCVKQFESMHCEIRSLEDSSFESDDSSFSVSIDCHSDDIKLTLILSATKGFLLNTMPIIGGQRLDSTPFQKDWCNELANRFLGRLKNKLLDHGCSLKMGLPLMLDSNSGQSKINSADFLATRVFEIVGSQEDSQIQCSLFIDLLNTEMQLDDYEDEDEDWFDESELQHL